MFSVSDICSTVTLIFYVFLLVSFVKKLKKDDKDEN